VKSAPAAAAQRSALAAILLTIAAAGVATPARVAAIVPEVHVSLSTLSIVALVCAACAVVILVAHLVLRPPLQGDAKIWLLFGLGVLPIGAAVTGNMHGYETTKKRAFCSSCHVMTPHTADADDPRSPSLASRHARNALFGDENCYVCHADYGMFGTVTTKLGGMEHVWRYFTQYRNVDIAEAEERIHLYKPFANTSCMQCHSTTLDIWRKVPDHKSSLEEVRANRVSCASAGCHGYAHPQTKPPAVKP
jgi:cytochrome c-type protein NapC